jgi:hypothetical protein
LLEIERDSDQCALDSHLAYLSGHHASPMRLASEEIPTAEFYDWCEARIKASPI